MTACLHFDCETTHLDPTELMVLEAAWCVTGPDGAQRTDMRHRYTAITAADRACYPNRNGANSSVMMRAARWYNDDAGHPEALDMAEKSGLYDDWCAAPASQVLCAAVELERLLLDDLAAHTDPGERASIVRRPFQIVWNGGEEPEWKRPPERAHLAGMGVAQFDQPVLRLLCDGVVAEPGETGALHYRSADVSVTQQVLLGSTKEHELINWGVGEWGDGITAIQWGAAPRCAYRPPGDTGWLTGEDKPHRAGLDVAKSIIIQRILWRWAMPLRQAIGVELSEAYA